MTPLTPEQMVAVKAIAPFEVQHALAAWADAARRDLDAHVERLGRELTVGDEVDARTWADGHGPPCPMEGERSLEFGLRAATALFHYLKEA